MKPFHLKVVTISIGEEVARLWLASHMYSGRTALARNPADAYETLVALLRTVRKRSDLYQMKAGYSATPPRQVVGA